MLTLLSLCDKIRFWARSKCLDKKAVLARRGEDLAHRFLQRQGMIVIGRNYRLAEGDGEVDLICRDGDQLVIVEVKTRTDEEHGAPWQAVDREKRKAMVRCASDIVRRTNSSWEQVRFDVVEVLLGPPLQIRHHRDLFHPKRN